MDNYVYFANGGIYCRIHSTYSLKGVCEVCSKSTSNSQVTTSNSQGVGVLGSQVTPQVKRTSRRTIFERFHNYGVRFEADVSWGNVSGRVVQLRNNVFYKRLDFPLALVKVFKRSILVTLRSSQDVKGLGVRSAEKLAQARVNEVLGLLPKSIVVYDRDVVSTHNAFVNEPIAKESLKVVVDDVLRVVSDRSKGRDELEFVSKDFAIDDSVKYEGVLRDYVTNPFDLPSVTKSKLDTILGVQLEYADLIRKHLLVQDKTLAYLEESTLNLNRLNMLFGSPQGSILKYSADSKGAGGFDSPLSPQPTIKWNGLSRLCPM
jgi:hypothetical protein